jgi:diaminohydroxyphosphoribosylaminopyrimidine deaminase/5-amino-6-(5-phosphoribosylamino)uracil reductase
MLIQEEQPFYMQRCLQLALLGLGRTRTNPMVGCVIVRENRIIAEGYHSGFGLPHAEADALSKVKDPALLSECTMYVNLEPCCHQGKTPPCTDAIIQSGIKRVVVAMEDPFPAVAGEGIRMLRRAGIDVTCGLLDMEARQLNRRFITYHSEKRPFVVLKWAQSADGFTGSTEKEIRISSSDSLELTHSWRSEEHGILIGSQTALTDNPSLNVRHWNGPEPVRILFDPNGRCSSVSHLTLFDGKSRTLVLTADSEASYPNAEVISLNGGSKPVHAITTALHESGIASILVEGGSRLHSLFLNEGIWDECRIITNPIRLEGECKAPGWPSGEMHCMQSGEDVVHFIRKIA